MSKGASKGELGWESLLNSDAPSGARLKAALLTSYEHSDERMLVEHLLPMLLKLEHEPREMAGKCSISGSNSTPVSSRCMGR